MSERIPTGEHDFTVNREVTRDDALAIITAAVDADIAPIAEDDPDTADYQKVFN